MPKSSSSRSPAPSPKGTNRTSPALGSATPQGRSCAQCRRLKIRCDKKVPCNGCIRRGCAEACPGDAVGNYKALFQRSQNLSAKVEMLEKELAHVRQFRDADKTSGQSPQAPPGPPGTIVKDSTAVEPINSYGPTNPMNALPDWLSYPTGLDGALATGSSNGRTRVGGSQFRHQLSPSTPSRGTPSAFGPAPALLNTEPALPGSGVGASDKSGELFSSARVTAVGSGAMGMETSHRPLSSSGTLVVEKTGGTSKFMGSSAFPQWLSEQDDDAFGGPTPSEQHQQQQQNRHGLVTLSASSPLHVFPFGNQRAHDLASVLAQLPEEDETRHLIDCYNRLIAWNGTPVLRDDLHSLRRTVYRSRSQETASVDEFVKYLTFHRLALMFSVMALGSLVNMELPPDDPSAYQWYELSLQCLSSGNFLVFNTYLSVQTTSILGRFCAYADMETGHELAWQIRGLGVRIMQAMGLHRDGERWQLSVKELELRRRVFWDAFIGDVSISRNWDRPNLISNQHFDTKRPPELVSEAYQSFRANLAVVVKDALDVSISLTPSSYETVKTIWQRLLAVELEVPHRIRCRPGLRAMLSRFPSIEAADAASPPTSKHDIPLTLQRYHLSLVSSCSVYLLLRPYFVDALHSHPTDPLLSPYADAFLAVVERASMIIAVLRDAWQTCPAVTARHWFFWAHAFSAGIWMSTVCVVAPGQPLVQLALAEVDSVISMFKSGLTLLPRTSLQRSLSRLVKLRSEANARVVSAQNRAMAAGSSNNAPNPRVETSENYLGLVGWRTRLVNLVTDAERRQAILTFPDGKVMKESDIRTQVASSVSQSDDFRAPATAGATVPFDTLDSSFDAISPDLIQQLLGGAPFDIPDFGTTHRWPMFDEEFPDVWQDGGGGGGDTGQGGD